VSEKAIKLTLEIERLRRIIFEAALFLEARRQDGIDFPYDSRPLRKLKEEAEPK
jgi:hypothetical protein